ncbi:MAG: glucosaminidase domain-containing protein [Treponemataceae bacterium]
MRFVRLHIGLIISAVLVVIFASCAGVPVRRVPLPAVPEEVLGQGEIEIERLAAFLCINNPAADPLRAKELASLYVEEAAIEGVNHDVAFAQMCLETGSLRFGNLVTEDMHNYCGLGSIGPGKPGERFPSARIGVRAHIQHLKAYATREPLKLAAVDPRYRYVRYGTAPTIASLAGKWASDPDYGKKIVAMLARMYGKRVSTFLLPTTRAYTREAKVYSPRSKSFPVPDSRLPG